MILMKNEEYIFEEDGKFVIRRELNGKLICFGSFNTLDEALDRRDELDFDGWPITVQHVDSPIVEENIEKISENQYIVFRYIGEEKDIYGPYDSLVAAKKAKNNLKATGWESDLDYAGSKYGKYIRKDHNKFVVYKIIKGENINFGTFDNLDDAKKHRDELIRNNWGKYNIKPKKGYGKYITKVGEKFRIQKAINGKIINFGYYDNLEEATKARDQFEKEKWKNIPQQSDFKRNIYKTSRGYVIFKRIDGKLTSFGTFKTMEDALKEREKLIANNWKIEKYPIDTFIEKYIQFDGNYYTIEKFVYKELRVYGVFKNKDLALKEKNRLQSEYWVSPYRKKTKEYPYGENIIPFDYLFNVEILQDGIFKEFGPFHSFIEAVKKCEEMENQNECVKDIVFDDVFYIYKHTQLISEPEIPFPQADIFEIFVNICEQLFEEESLEREQIMEYFDINPRQYSFYISAGEYLGLIERNKINTKYLSKKGIDVFSLEEMDKKLELVKLILQHKPFNDVFKEYVKTGQVPPSNDIYEILKKYEIYNVNSDVTLKRRATSVRGWINWIVNLYDDSNAF